MIRGADIDLTTDDTPGSLRGVPFLRGKVAEATELLAVADADLDRVGAAFRPVVIGDKRVLTAELAASLDRRREAKKVLEDWGALLAAKL